MAAIAAQVREDAATYVKVDQHRRHAHPDGIIEQDFAQRALSRIRRPHELHSSPPSGKRAN